MLCCDRSILCFSEGLFDVEIPVLYLKAEYEIFAAINISCLMPVNRECVIIVRNNMSWKLL